MHLDLSIMYTSGCRDFIKGWALGKLTSCEGDFARQVCTYGGKVLLIERFSLKILTIINYYYLMQSLHYERSPIK